MNRALSKFHGLFSEESKEHLTRLSSLLMHLEKAPSSERRAILEELFRNAHSIKGSAGMLELELTAKTAHRLENALSALQSLPTEAFDALLHSENFLDRLLAGVDCIADCIQTELSSKDAPAPTTLFDDIDAILKKAAPLPVDTSSEASADVDPKAEPSRRSALELPPDLQGPVVVVRMTISAQSRMPAMRAYLAYKKIGEMAPLVVADPSMNEVKSGVLPEDRTLRLVTLAKVEDVRRVVASLSEIEDVDISTQMPPPPAVPPKEVVQPPSESPMQPEEKIDSGDVEVDRKPEPTLRVKTALLDTLLDTVGDFIFSLTRLREDAKTRLNQHDGDEMTLGFGAKDPLLEALDTLHREARALHSQVISARMTPLSSITDQLRRAVRELVRTSGKNVDFQISGEGTELDHAVLEILTAPLIHLIRNAVDHGMELPAEREAMGKVRQGTLRLLATRKRSHVTVTISDDGRGLDAAKLKAKAVSRGAITQESAQTMSDEDAWQLCFLPGLSTRDTVTNVSGRGVGMDVVKSTIESVGGAVFVKSEPGKGTTWTLSLPYTIAIAHILFVRVGNDTFGLPISNLVHIAMASPSSLVRSGSDEPLKFKFQGENIPVFPLGKLLGLRDEGGLSEEQFDGGSRIKSSRDDKDGQRNTSKKDGKGPRSDDGSVLAGRATKPNSKYPPKKSHHHSDTSLPWQTDGQGNASELLQATSTSDLSDPPSGGNVLMEGWVDDVGHVTLFHDGVRTLDVGKGPILHAPTTDDSMMIPFVPDAREATTLEKPLIVFQTESGKRIALIADDLCGQQRSILRPLKPPLDTIPCLFGVTLQSNGLPAFILNIGRLF